MMNFKNDPVFRRSKLWIASVLIITQLAVAQGCAPTPAQDTTLPPPATATLVPLPAVTATLAPLKEGLVYIAVGLTPQQTLPIYQEPSLGAPQTGQVPAAGKNIRTTGLEMEGEGLLWLQIKYQGAAGWVDSSFLALQKGDLPRELAQLAGRVVAALKVADYRRLEGIIHPEDCLRFSPYPYLRENDQVFCPEELRALSGSDSLYLWGNYDGSGEPIELSFDDYHQRFVYDQDFFQSAVVGLNQEVSSGNAINNIPDLYPGGMIVEYHFPGFDPQYGGLDWRSLRLVFIQDNGEWFLAALVHGEWTI